MDNNGERRAQQTLRHLTLIGANRTARWLMTALAATENPQALERLDREFTKNPEDLASLVMRYIAEQSRTPTLRDGK